MLSIAICDDETLYVQQTENFVQEYLRCHPECSGQVHTFRHGQELLCQVEETGGFDLYLLDIVIPNAPDRSIPSGTGKSCSAMWRRPGASTSIFWTSSCRG